MKDRLLNILLFTFIGLLLLNIFLPKPQEQKVQSTPHFVLSKTAVVIPNVPKLSLNNPTEKEIRFDSCRDLSILANLNTINISVEKPEFCKEIIVAPKTSFYFDLAPISVVFTKPANIGFKLAVEGVTEPLTATVEVQERGFFRTILATIFYAPILNFFLALIEYLPGNSLGLAIIVITIIVRIILLVPQHQMLVSARKMQAIQPKLLAIQVKFK